MCHWCEQPLRDCVFAVLAVLDFGHLHKMLDILHKHQVMGVHLPHLFTHTPAQSPAYQDQCQKALDCLMAQGMYEDAYTFGQCAGLDLSAVALRHVRLLCSFVMLAISVTVGS